MDGENDPLNLHNGDAPVDRFRKIREELEAMELPDLPDDNELHERMPILKDAGNPNRFPEAPHVKITRKNPAMNTSDDKGGQRSLGRGIVAGYSLLAAVIGFGFIGWLINHPMGGLFGAVFGAVAGLVFCVKLLNQT